MQFQLKAEGACVADIKKSKKNLAPIYEKEQLIALRDFAIVHNEYRRSIKKGEDISDVPEIYHPNLITEGVISQ